jgi:DNA mismatch endonuclease, patch repair protein
MTPRSRQPRARTRLEPASRDAKSQEMSRVPSRDTAPELRLRKLLNARGVRYRLHRKDIPGTPDLYVPRLRLALFVNGCFWHGHNCPRGRRPASNVEFWDTKISRNVERDAATQRALLAEGIEAFVLWTCCPDDFDRVARHVARRYRAII